MRSDRGDVGLRMVVVMALVAGLVWAVPMVLLSRQEVQHAADLTGANDAPAGAGASGVVVQAPADPIGQANDVSAQADLNNALVAAQTFFAEKGTFQGFAPAAAAEYDPSITYTASSASAGVISIRGVSATTVVLVTSADRGAPLCAAVTGAVVSFGRTDAQTAGQCQGGW